MTTASPKAEMKETKAKREAREKEENEGTPPPAILPIAAGQLDKALPATRLLEKRRLMHLVHDELECQKVDFTKYVVSIFYKRLDLAVS
jgi:hypothetical protein